MKLIGLTGGIGSGKSTVAGLFVTLGIPVYDSDARAKQLMESDTRLREEITDRFGEETYFPNNELNRSFLASRVFSDQSQLEILNNIVHPAVYTDLIQWADQPAQKNAPYLIQESAILYEENLTARFESIILIVADEDVRIKRVMDRDQVTKEDVLKRMQHQWPDEKKIILADYIIFNDGERSLISQVMDIDKMIRSS